MANVRPVEEKDVAGIAELYRAVYGDEYPFKEFYDTEWIKRGVFDRGIRWLVATDDDGGLIGSTAAMLNAGDSDDLVSEIGRLVVHPKTRGQGLGTDLVVAITEVADELSDFAFAECRTAHVGSQLIFERLGYHTVGVEPLTYEIDGHHESVVFVCRLSENARRLRKGSPRVIPAAYELASLALAGCGLPDDVTAEPDPMPYPSLWPSSDVVLEDLDTRQVYRVLKLSRENFLQPQVFGAFRLEHGHLKLVQHKARYLVLKRGDVVLGGLGYTFDPVDRKVEVFELVAVDGRARGTLLNLGLRELEERHDPRLIAVDVNAHATRMQQSLHLMGFAPVVYAPSMVYVMGERFDVIKMVKVREGTGLTRWKLLDSMKRMAQLTERAVVATRQSIELDSVTREMPLFQGLTDVQIGEVRSICSERSYDEFEVVFHQGADDEVLLVVLEGVVDIVKEGKSEPINRIRKGEIFGEMSLIEALPRSAGAICRAPARLLVLEPAAFAELTRRDPEAGVVILKNIGHVLSKRVRRLDERIMKGV